ncbi:MAG TPA: shikimate kinase AroL [Desulfonatronum sp.]|nr:shikimate kinase AroL [Desulfonatronum sp.]
MSKFIRNKVKIANPDARMVRAHGVPRDGARFDPRKANIFLVGLRGSGKTTLGRLLAERLDVMFVDTDEMVVRQAGKDIASIVASQGWAGFRSSEKDTLREICTRKGQVVATGGGIVLEPSNRALLESGLVFYLMAEIPTLEERLAKNPLPAQRPALSEASLVQELRHCLYERGPLYMCTANHVLHAEKKPAVLVEEILEKLGWSTMDDSKI